MNDKNAIMQRFSRQSRVLMQFKVFNITISFLILIGCGASNIAGNLDPCRVAEKETRKRLGPEFDRVLVKVPLSVSERSRGCAITFIRISEELPGEVHGGLMDSGTSEELAIALPDIDGRFIVDFPSPPAYRANTVELQLELKEIDGTPPLELVVREFFKHYKDPYEGLQLYTFAEGVPSPRLLLSERLLLETPEKIKVIPKWEVIQTEELKMIVFSGAGEYLAFVWDPNAQRYIKDLSATQRIKLKRNPSTVTQSSMPLDQQVDQQKASQKKSEPTSTETFLKSLQKK